MTRIRPLCLALLVLLSVSACSAGRVKPVKNRNSRLGNDMVRNPVQPWGGWGKGFTNSSTARMRAAPTLPSDFTTYWMSDLWKYVANQPINRIWMPGTHDSATYDLSDEIRPPGREDFDNGCPVDWKLLGGEFKKFAVAQLKSLKQQVRDGARYLDLRITNYMTNGDDRFKFIHCVISKQSVKKELTDLSNFLSERYGPPNKRNGQSPREVVFLNFYQFSNFFSGDQNYQLHRDFMQYVLSCFKPGQVAVLDPNDYENQNKVPTLAELTKNGAQVVLIYNVGSISNWNWDAMDPEARKYFVKQEAFMQRPYGDKNKLKDLLDYNYNQYVNYRTSKDTFFVMEGVLTPKFGDTVANPSLQKYERGVGEGVTMWVWDDLFWWFYANVNSEEEKKNFKPVVVMLDFLEPTWSTLIALLNTHKETTYFIPGYYGKCSSDFVWFSGCEMNPAKGRGWNKCAEGYPYTKSGRSTTCWCQCCRDPELTDCGCQLNSKDDGDLGKCW